MLRNFVKTQMDKVTKNLENNELFSQEELAIACDLNLEFFLAPKSWVFDIVTAKIVNFNPFKPFSIGEFLLLSECLDEFKCWESRVDDLEYSSFG